MLSEEITDEVEAINSIYGENSLIPSKGDDDGIFILRLPGETETSSLRLQFPPMYPISEPPVVLGTHSSGEHARRGAAARDLDLFRQAVGTVFQPGQVCLFDAIEELTRLLELHAAAEAEEEEDGHDEDEASARATEMAAAKAATNELSVDPDQPPPPWILSEPMTEMKSTFIARCAHVTSTSEAEAFVQHLLATDKRARAATHNITAWRIRGANGVAFQDCDDDGETAAGSRLLHLMQLMDLWDTMVIVTRWYGGQKLGPRRFAVINQVARDAFVRAGLVSDPSAPTAVASSTSNKKKAHGR